MFVVVGVNTGEGSVNIGNPADSPPTESPNNWSPLYEVLQTIEPLITAVYIEFWLAEAAYELERLPLSRL